MQTSILTLLLALGLPGANSCNAQQPELPRVGQNQPAHTHGDDDSDDDCDDEADDDSDGDDAEEMDTDDAVEVDVGEVEEMDADDLADVTEQYVFADMAEQAQAQAGQCEKTQSKSSCQSKCEGSGSCGETKVRAGSQGGAAGMLGALGYSGDGHVVRLKEKDLEGKVQKLTIQPGSTVVLETKNGKQVVLRAQPGPMTFTEPAAMPSMSALAGLTAIAQNAQPQDQRVRELEERVRQLEAQLRERDGQRGARAPRAMNPFGYAGPAKDKHSQEMAAEIRERASVQARDYAKQARVQAEAMRAQGEEIRKHALEQAEHWRVMAREQAQEGRKLRFAVTPQAGPTPPSAPSAPSPAEAGEPAELPQGAWWSEAKPVPPTPGVQMYRAGPAPRAAQTRNGQGGDMHEMQSLMDQMRTQMEEMRAQMQALREELQHAPQHGMR